MHDNDNDAGRMELISNLSSIDKEAFWWDNVIKEGKSRYKSCMQDLTEYFSYRPKPGVGIPIGSVSGKKTLRNLFSPDTDFPSAEDYEGHVAALKSGDRISSDFGGIRLEARVQEPFLFTRLMFDEITCRSYLFGSDRLYLEIYVGILQRVLDLSEYRLPNYGNAIYGDFSEPFLIDPRRADMELSILVKTNELLDNVSIAQIFEGGSYQGF